MSRKLFYELAAHYLDTTFDYNFLNDCDGIRLESDSARRTAEALEPDHNSSPLVLGHS